MTTYAPIQIQKLATTLGGFQKCHVNHPELEERLEEENQKFSGEWEKWVCIHLRELQVGIIGRVCKKRVTDATGTIRCDMRVWKLFGSLVLSSRKGDSGKGSGDDGQSQSKESQCDISASDGNVIDKNQDSDSEELELEAEEMLLARHVVRLERKYVMMQDSLETSSSNNCQGLGVNFTCSCAPDSVELVRRIGIVEEMLVSAIFKSEDTELPYQLDPLLESVLKEKVRDILEANGAVVTGQSFVDVRQCPLAQSSFLLPPIAYLYIQRCRISFKKSKDIEDERECEMRTGIRAGRVVLRSRVMIERKRSQDVKYYERLFDSTLPPTMSVAGLEGAIQRLEDMMRMREEKLKLSKSGLEPDMDFGHFSHGLLIAGSPGCGKSVVVREAAKKLRAKLLVLELSDRDSGSKSGLDVLGVGDRWTKMFSAAIASARVCPTLLLLQQLQFLTVAEGKSPDSPTAIAKAKLVNHLCELFDTIPSHVSLFVVATSNKPHLIPQKLRRSGRLEHELHIQVPNVSERQKIIESLTRSIPAFRDCDVSQLAKETPGFTGADLERLVHVIALKANEGDSRVVGDADLKYGLSRVLPSLLQGSVGLVGTSGGSGSSLDHISGLRSVKLDLIKAIVWPLKYPRAFLTMAILPPKGILLYGPPGCAKTSLVRAVAGSHETNFLAVSAAELFASGVGDSEKIISDLFHRASSASPSILFIDELEAIVGSRQGSSKGKSFSDTILSTFLTEMDGIGAHAPVSTVNHNQGGDGEEVVLGGPRVVVVAATNRPDLIDSALLRPGRLDRIIAVPPPDESERLELLENVTSKMPLAQDVDLLDIAKKTERYSGADLVGLCKEAALFALEGDMGAESVCMDNFTRALAQSSPSISPRTLRDFHEYQQRQQQQPSS